MAQVSRLVGWMDDAEWCQVQAMVCSPSAHVQLQAYQRLLMWHARIKLPIAIESTMNLLNPIINDALQR
jgi:hypothetical protein